MLDLCEHLKEKPTLYQNEMVLFLWDEFGKYVTIQRCGTGSWSELFKYNIKIHCGTHYGASKAMNGNDLLICPRRCSP